MFVAGVEKVFGLLIAAHRSGRRDDVVWSVYKLRDGFSLLQRVCHFPLHMIDIRGDERF